MKQIWKITDIIIDNPYIIEENRKIRYITPNEARLRDLTYDSPISLNITEKLAPGIDKKKVIVSESGIKSRKDILRLKKAGAKAALIGETLMTTNNPGTTISELLGSKFKGN